MERAFPSGLEAEHLNRSAAGPPAWLRLAAIAALPLIALAGLLGGTRAETVSVRSPAAAVSVRSPQILRNGLLFETEIEVLARRPIQDAVIAISARHWRDFTINTMIPAATEEEYKDGEYRFHFDRLEAGDRLLFKVDGQINPPHFGSDSSRVRLLDDETEIAVVSTSRIVLP